MTVAKPIDVADRLGKSFSESETTRIQVLLDDVESMILGRHPGLVGLDAAAAKRVECWVVIRFLRNPDGAVQESIDDHSFTRDKSAVVVGLTLTDADWDALQPTTIVSGGAFEIVLGSS